MEKKGNEKRTCDNIRIPIKLPPNLHLVAQIAKVHISVSTPLIIVHEQILLGRCLGRTVDDNLVARVVVGEAEAELERVALVLARELVQVEQMPWLVGLRDFLLYRVAGEGGSVQERREEVWVCGSGSSWCWRWCCEDLRRKERSDGDERRCE